jgi:hypothetical protein
MSEFHIAETLAENSTENEVFARYLKLWLQGKGVDPSQLVTCLIVPLMADGFDVMALGPTPVSTEQAIEWLVQAGQMALSMEPHEPVPAHLRRVAREPRDYFDSEAADNA